MNWDLIIKLIGAIAALIGAILAAIQIHNLICPVPQTKTPPPPPTKFTLLERHLSAREWLNADQETLKFINNKDKITSGDLKIIDDLWMKYSNNKFGFSAQKQVYESLGGGNDFHGSITGDFFDEVKWKKSNNFLSYRDYIFNLGQAPKGHLPSHNLRRVEKIVWLFWWNAKGEHFFYS